MTNSIKTAVLLLVLLMAPRSLAAEGGGLGSIEFPVTGGTSAARESFIRGLLALHSFWYEEAQAQFGAAAKADPGFAMAWWGIAMSHAKLLWYEDDLEVGREALAKITDMDKLTPRERAYVGAARALFAEGDQRARRVAYATAMEQVHRQFPDDDEATTLYALALDVAAQPDEPDYVAQRVRAAALAQEVFQRNPQHPGAAHYIIHALDTNDLAPLALPAARAYAAIAPEAFHARHMPAHIFSRLGMWQESIDSCQSAWEASVAWTTREKLSADLRDYHSLNWVVENHFELGQRRAADAAMKLWAEAVRGGVNHDVRAAYAGQVLSYLERTGEWGRLDELTEPLAAPATEAKPEEMMRCGMSAPAALEPPPSAEFERMAVNALHAEAAARKRDLAAAKRLLEDRDAIEEQIRPWSRKQMSEERYARELKADALEKKRLLAQARGDDKALLAAQRVEAAESESYSGGEGTAGAFIAHEQIAATLARLGRHAEALAEYEGVVRGHANRTRAMLGAAREAAAAGDPKASKGWYEKLAALWAGADDDFPGVQEARERAR
jgi:hypothetical protein